jgi:hypothetical protein
MLVDETFRHTLGSPAKKGIFRRRDVRIRGPLLSARTDPTEFLRTWQPSRTGRLRAGRRITHSAPARDFVLSLSNAAICELSLIPDATVLTPGGVFDVDFAGRCWGGRGVAKLAAWQPAVTCIEKKKSLAPCRNQAESLGGGQASPKALSSLF